MWNDGELEMIFIKGTVTEGHADNMVKTIIYLLHQL